MEKTLELNITHEILSLADSFWWFLQPISLKRYWRPHWRFPFISSPKSFATGLPISLEGRPGGGYDVRINSPPNFQGGNPRLLFMQFKAGEEKAFNSDKNSIFFGDRDNKNIHVEFEINNNKNRNQHKILQQCAANAGNEDAVVYVFPRIVSNTQLQKYNGKLLSKTSFISISEIDAKAAENKIDINDGNIHKFRTCYNDHYKNEVNFFFFFFGKPKKPGGLLGEIFTVRMFRAFQELKNIQIDKYPISKNHIIDAIIRHIFNLGLYFSVPQNRLEDLLKELFPYSSRLNYLREYEDLPKVYEIEKQTENLYEEEIFKDILLAIAQYFEWIEYIKHFGNVEIPPPTTKYTIEISDNEIRIPINLEKITLEDFDNISYTFF